jgi:hypothetical protein
MTRLLRVELTRLRWRRAVLLLLGAVVAVPVVFGIAVAWNTQPPSAEEQAAAERQVELERERPYVQRDLRRCLEKPRQWGIDPESPDLRSICEESVLPQVEWYLYWEQLDLVQERDETGLAVVAMVSALLLLAGTTFVGHDWNSGSMSNQLLFEPRRARVWSAKALIVFAVSGVLSLAVLSGYWLALWAVARSRDLPATSEILVDCLQDGLRGACLAAFAALGGYALTMLFRSTVATLGVLFAVSVAGGALIAVLGIDAKYQPQTNLAAVVLDGAEYYVQVPDECYGMRPPEGAVCDETKVLPASNGALLLGGLSVLAGAASVLSFRRRDVP